MVFQNYKWTENAETTFDWDVSASSTTWIVHPWEWALYPTTFPFLLTGEKYSATETPQVIGREIVKVTGSPAADQFTVVRQFAPCVQNDTLDPKVQSNGPQTFLSGDKISLYKTAVDDEDMKNELVSLRTEVDTNIPATYATKEDVQRGSYIYAASSTWNDDYSITLDPAPTSLVSLKTSIFFLPDVDSSWACSLEINWLWVKTLREANQVNAVVKAWFKVEVLYNEADDVYDIISQTQAILNVEVETTESNIILWEDVSAWNYLRKWRWVVSTWWVNQIWNTSLSYWTFSLKRDTNNEKAWQNFDVIANVKITTIAVKLRRNGNPVGNITAKIFSDQWTTLLHTSTNTVAEWSVVSWSYYNFTFDDIILPAWNYYIELSTDRATNSTSNNTQPYFWFNSTDTQWVAYTINSGWTWSTPNSTYDLDIRVTYVWITEDLWKFFKTDASNIWTSIYDVIAKTSWSTDDVIKWILGPIDNTKTWLTLWDEMFLSNTPWEISTTPWTNNVKVGDCISTDLILLTKGSSVSANAVLISRSWSAAAIPVTYSHWLNKRPSAIMFTMYWGFNTTNAMPTSQGTYDWENNRCIFKKYNTAPASVDWNCIYMEYNTTVYKWRITSMTDIDFEITWENVNWFAWNTLNIIATLIK